MKRLKLAAFSLVFVLAACGGGGGGNDLAPVNPTPAPAPSPTPTSSPEPDAVTVSYLHVFSIEEGDGAQPNGPLMQASDGNFYGTTRAGGTHQCGPYNDFPCGVLFRITPSGDEAVLHQFGSAGSDGYTPTAPLVQGEDGALYGMTSNGGEHDGGTVFRITLGGTYTVLYSFGSSPKDAIVPTGGLVQADDGDFYGVTASGGANHCAQIPQDGGNCGTIFKITPDGEETVLYSFGTSPSDGVEPNASLLQASDGNFYGTTLNGGANACSNVGATHNCGTAFKMDAAGKVTVLYSFGKSRTDGIAPQGTLIEGRDGNFYGTTVSGGGGQCGGSFGCGTVFRMTASGDVKVLHAFSNSSPSDGDGPSEVLVQGSDGNFYGTTGSGGSKGGSLNGTIFRLTPSGALTTLYSFGPLDKNPSNPLGGLIRARDGAFYGITNYNGTLGASGARGGSGTVFKMEIR